mmetsp:Transcript_4390/g.12924  ORF Transcript_4390/g.12924 Transcript_4390/m.12924 type:complete len:364 (-) Transcript_4390:8-1099(-)
MRKNWRSFSRLDRLLLLRLLLLWQLLLDELPLDAIGGHLALANLALDVRHRVVPVDSEHLAEEQDLVLSAVGALPVQDQGVLQHHLGQGVAKHVQDGEDDDPHGDEPEGLRELHELGYAEPGEEVEDEQKAQGDANARDVQEGQSEVVHPHVRVHPAGSDAAPRPPNRERRTLRLELELELVELLVAQDGLAHGVRLGRLQEHLLLLGHRHHGRTLPKKLVLEHVELLVAQARVVAQVELPQGVQVLLFHLSQSLLLLHRLPRVVQRAERINVLVEGHVLVQGHVLALRLLRRPAKHGTPLDSWPPRRRDGGPQAAGLPPPRLRHSMVRLARRGRHLVLVPHRLLHPSPLVSLPASFALLDAS